MRHLNDKQKRRYANNYTNIIDRKVILKKDLQPR